MRNGSNSGGDGHKKKSQKKTSTMDNIFAEGSTVHAVTTPSVKLTIRRYVDRVYYCTQQSAPTNKELVYFERDLAAENTI